MYMSYMLCWQIICLRSPILDEFATLKAVGLFIRYYNYKIKFNRYNYLISRCVSACAAIAGGVTSSVYAVVEFIKVSVSSHIGAVSLLSSWSLTLSVAISACVMAWGQISAVRARSVARPCMSDSGASC